MRATASHEPTGLQPGPGTRAEAGVAVARAVSSTVAAGRTPPGYRASRSAPSSARHRRSVWPRRGVVPAIRRAVAVSRGRLSGAVRGGAGGAGTGAWGCGSYAPPFSSHKARKAAQVSSSARGLAPHWWTAFGSGPYSSRRSGSSFGSLRRTHAAPLLRGWPV